MDRNSTVTEIRRFDGSFDGAGKSDAYLQSALDTWKRRGARTDAAPAEIVQRFGSGGRVERIDATADRNDAGNASAARDRMKDRMSNAWRGDASDSTNPSAKTKAEPAPTDIDGARRRMLARQRGSNE